MIISRTPYRVSFFGGGTDYPAWYERHGGCVLATSINRYCYLTCRYLPPFFRHKHRIVYSKIEDVQSIEEIQHPAVRACLQFLNFTEGLEIHHDGDLPKQSGLGTSSSFAVGLLHALHALRGEWVSPMQLTREAIHVERDLCRETVGSQDQTTAAHGGLNYIEFLPGDIIKVQPVILPPARRRLFQQHLMLFFTGFPRHASVVAGAQVRNMAQREAELSAMQRMVPQALEILTGHGDLRPFGELLHQSWQLKRSLGEGVSTPEVDAMYETARKAGAIGGKLCGAGGGGFMLLFVEPQRQADVRRALSSYLYVPFEFETEGSRIIFYQPTEPIP